MILLWIGGGVGVVMQPPVDNATACQSADMNRIPSEHIHGDIRYKVVQAMTVSLSGAEIKQR